MPAPPVPEIELYHLVHVDRLASIVADGFLWSDAKVIELGRGGTTIGMGTIKQRRLNELPLASHFGLRVGQCVPFYFCPRPVMLHAIHAANDPDLAYQGGQSPILHLEFALGDVAAWAEAQGRRWAFTTSNAGAYRFRDYANLGELDRIDWEAVQAREFRPEHKDGRQAEFLVEESVPWQLVSRVGARDGLRSEQAYDIIKGSGHEPPVEAVPSWYFG